MTTLDEPGVVKDGLCSFTEAIAGVQSGSDDGRGCAVALDADTVSLEGLSGTITMTQGGTPLAPLYGVLNIVGPGADQLTIDFDGLRGFDTSGQGVEISLRGLTVRGSGSISALLVNAPDTVVVEDCVFTENTTTSNGAAIRQDGGATLTVSRTLFLANTCAGPSGYRSGAGIWSEGALTVRDSAFVGNASDSDGGAVLVGAGGVATIVNSTFSGNSGESGGGLAVVNAFGHPTGPVVTVVNSTFVGNQADNAGGGFSLSASNGGSLTVRGTVSSANTAAKLGPDCDNGDGQAGTLTSGGYNLFGILDGCSALIPGAGDQFGSAAVPLDPLLGELTAASTIRPTTGSPLIDAIPVSACLDAAGEPLLADQRGYDRPGHRAGIPDACDIGAHEVGCGDGLIDAGEACDDGNDDETDGCLSTCEVQTGTSGTTGETSDTGTLPPETTDTGAPTTGTPSPPGPEEPKGGGCGCASGGTSAGLSALLVLVAGVSRRHPRRGAGPRR